MCQLNVLRETTMRAGPQLNQSPESAPFMLFFKDVSNL